MIDFPERRLIARVTRAERVGPKPYGRTSFEFDAIDSETPIDDLDRAFADPGFREPFAAVRVVTTKKRFSTLFDFVPDEGMWVELELAPDTCGFQRPITFHSQLEENGYSRHSEGRLRGARLLALPGEPPRPPVSIGAAASQSTRLAHALAARCAFPATAIASSTAIRRQLKRLNLAGSILVRDVGQASFVSLICAHCKDHTLGHFDAGWPISFNGHTAPTTAPTIVRSGPVVLSHWDWDHLHGYHKCADLRRSSWITPVQPLGPGAYKVATELHQRNLLFGCAQPVNVGNVDLVICSGPHAMNDTGLALIIQLWSGKRALLVGDASYDAVGAPWKALKYDMLVVTHHGADFQGTPPTPSVHDAPAVVSVGRGNVYKHPRATALNAHAGAHWKILRTSTVGRAKRGDKTLS